MTRVLSAGVLVMAPFLQAQTKHVVVISHRSEHLHHPENTMPATGWRTTWRFTRGGFRRRFRI